MDAYRVVFGPGGVRYVRACGANLPVQWDAHLGQWAETRQP
jgi:hypothetical protein